MFSIIIPTLNNLEYLKICIKSINKNSMYKHEIIPHVNIGNDGTTEYLEKNNIKFTHTTYNSGICKGMNLASKLINNDYIWFHLNSFPSSYVIMYSTLTDLHDSSLNNCLNVITNLTK